MNGMTKGRLLRATFALGLGLLGTAAACSGKKNTEVVVAIATDVRIPKDLNAVTIRVLSRGAVQYQESHEVGPTGLHLPGTIGLVPQDDGDLQPIEVQIVGQYGSNPDVRLREERVLRKTRLTFAKNRVGFVRIPLKFGCWGEPDCGEGKTCIAGACQTMPVLEGVNLLEYKPELAFGAGGGNGKTGVCWNADDCLRAAVDAPVTSDPCVFAPVDTSKPVSVAIATGPAGLGWCSGGECRVPLDLDELEGWTWADANKTQIRLAQGLCTKVLASKGVLRVQATTACATKTPELPICIVDDSDAACTPKSCTDLGWQCGVGDDGCGTPLDCGTCAPIYDCGPVTHKCEPKGDGGTDSGSDTPDGTVTDTAPGDATPPDGAVDAAVSSLSITGGPSAAVVVGYKAALKAIGTLAAGGSTDLTESCAWSAGDPTILFVSNISGSRGQIQALTSGTTQVIATYGTLTAKWDVTVGATDGGTPPDSAADTSVTDSFVPPDSTVTDTTVTDTFVPDTFVPPDTTVTDSFVPDTFVPPDTSVTDTFVDDTFVPPDSASADTDVADSGTPPPDTSVSD